MAAPGAILKPISAAGSVEGLDHDRDIRRLPQGPDRQTGEEVVHGRVAYHDRIDHLGGLGPRGGAQVSQEGVEALDQPGLQAGQVVRIQVGVRDPADHVFPEGNLRVHHSLLGRRLAALQVNQVCGQLGRTDVNRQAKQGAAWCEHAYQGGGQTAGSRAAERQPGVPAQAAQPFGEIRERREADLQGRDAGLRQGFGQAEGIGAQVRQAGRRQADLAGRYRRIEPGRVAGAFLALDLQALRCRERFGGNVNLDVAQWGSLAGQAHPERAIVGIQSIFFGLGQGGQLSANQPDPAGMAKTGAAAQRDEGHPGRSGGIQQGRPRRHLYPPANRFQVDAKRAGW